MARSLIMPGRNLYRSVALEFAPRVIFILFFLSPTEHHLVNDSRYYTDRMDRVMGRGFASRKVDSGTVLYISAASPLSLQH